MSDFDGANHSGSRASQAVPPAVRDRVGEGAGLVGDKANDVAGTAREQAADVAGEASARARDVAGELRGQLQEQARTQTQRLADNVRRLAGELQDMSERDGNDSSAARAVRQIADGGHRAASRIEHRGPDGLVSDLQDFARRRPGGLPGGCRAPGLRHRPHRKGRQVRGRRHRRAGARSSRLRREER
ncbi:hypothetical protein [Streptomyces nitrosporeus]|uniref:hypothetical protein n=1 Tax=Streptomyces nitrosporeus TaxID=28894 RepID=UPI00331B3955